MINVVGISFKKNGRIYYFDPNGYKLKKNITVIVKTEQGLKFGKVSEPSINIAEDKLKGKLKKVIRISSRADYNNHRKNLKDATIALKKCRELVEKNELNMNIISSEYTFDRDKLIFRFLADNRVDFRQLAKDLAAIYKVRIELRQVGPRDKAKEIGGYGQCGQKLCCSRFLKELDTVSINMAKNQNIALNPSKINGLCGRLLCCLKYENDCYKECRANMHKIGDEIETEEGFGKVVGLDILRQKYKVEVPSVGIVWVEKNESN